MNTKLLIIFILLCFSATAMPQDTGRILGIVTNAQAGDSLADVNVSLSESSLGTSTNAKGAYMINQIPPGTYTVVFSNMGFAADSVQNIAVAAGESKRLDAQLQPTVLEMSAVEIEANRVLTFAADSSQVGVQRINPRAVQRMAGSLNDLNRVVNLLNGTTGSGDYTGWYAVRGGTLDQNMVYMDGLVIPNPYRLRLLLGGGFGLFNTATIDEAQFYTSHFPSQYGNFLSSVMSIESRDGRRDRFGVHGSLDFLQANVVLEGPFPGNRGSYLISARRSFIDVFANGLIGNQSKLPYMFDLDSKLVYDVTDRTQISYKFLSTDEKTKMIAETDQDVEIEEGAKLHMHILALESQVSDRARATFRTAFYDETFDYQLYADKSDPLASSGDYRSDIQSFNVHQQLSLDLHDNHRIDQGVYVSSETSQLDLETNVVSVGFTRRDVPPNIFFDNNSGHIGAYVDYSARFVKDLESVVGLRYDYSELIKKDNLSAKLSLLYHITPDLRVHAFWGQVHQYPNVMTLFTRDVPLDFSQHPERLAAESATHVVLGIDRTWNYNISTRLELYYKDYNRLLLPQDRVSYVPDNSGEGYARGLDLTIEKAKGPNGWFSGLLTYSYGKSEYRDSRDGMWIPFNFDRRHGITALADVTIYKQWGANAVWRYNSGLPYNDIRGYMWNVYDRSRYIKSTHNENRYPAYSRVDLRLYYHGRGPTTSVMLYLDFMNLFNRQNVYEHMYYTLDTDNDDGSETKTFKYATIYNMPFIPSLGITVWY